MICRQDAVPVVPQRRDDQFQVMGLPTVGQNPSRDLGGNDTYSAGEPACPAANLSAEAPHGDPRETKPTIGLFIDLGGTDSYQIGGSTVTRGDGSTWKNNRRSPAIAGEHSGGVDSADGMITW